MTRVTSVAAKPSDLDAGFLSGRVVSPPDAGAGHSDDEVRHHFETVLVPTRSRSPPDRFIARRWASFVGPLRAKSWRADD